MRTELENLRAPGREVALRADFDLLEDDGRIRLSLRFVRGVGAPEQGDVVYLLDDLGRGCVARIEEVDGWYVQARPDWASWTGEELPTKAAARHR